MTDNHQPNSTIKRESYSTGVTLIWHYNKLIAEFDMSNFTLKRDVVDEFIEKIKDYGVKYCPNGYIITMYNFSAHRMPPFSSYFKQRSQEATNQVPDHFTGRSAVVLRSSPLTQLYKLSIRAMNVAKKRDHRVERRVFLNYDEAMAWLVEFADEVKNGDNIDT